MPGQPANLPPPPPANPQWGVRLGKELMSVAARALRANMTSLGPRVLPLSEQLAFAANFAVRRLAASNKALAVKLPAAWTKAYTPDFKKAVDHLCIHTGGWREWLLWGFKV